MRRAKRCLQADRSSPHRLRGCSRPGRGFIEGAAAEESAGDLGVSVALLDAQRHALQPRRRDGHHRLAPAAGSGLAENEGPQHLGGTSRVAAVRCAQRVKVGEILSGHTISTRGMLKLRCAQLES